MRDYTPSDLCDELGPDAEPQCTSVGFFFRGKPLKANVFENNRFYPDPADLGSDFEPHWLDMPRMVEKSPLYRKHHRCGLCLAAIALGFVVACIVVALGVL